MKAGHKSRNLVNVGGFFSADRTSQYLSLAVLRNLQKSVVRLMCNFGVHSRFLDVIYGVRPPNGSPAY